MIYNIIYNTMKKQILIIYKIIKSKLISLFPSLKGEAQREFRFYKESSGRWYVDLPEWKAAKWHLEMVAGADDVLDSLKSKHRNDVKIFVSLEPIDDALELTKIQNDPHGDGADYVYNNPKTKRTESVWLCGVTEWYYGFMPEKIYFRKVLD